MLTAPVLATDSVTAASALAIPLLERVGVVGSALLVAVLSALLAGLAAGIAAALQLAEGGEYPRTCKEAPWQAIAS